MLFLGCADLHSLVFPIIRCYLGKLQLTVPKVHVFRITQLNQWGFMINSIFMKFGKFSVAYGLMGICQPGDRSFGTEQSGPTGY